MSWVRRFLPPAGILVAGLIVTGGAWEHEREASRDDVRIQFEFSMRETVARVEQRMASYADMLRGVQGLVNATGKLEGTALHEYVDALNMESNYLGIQAVSVNRWIPAAEKNAHVDRMRQLGIKDYAVKPDGVRDNYAPVTQREPSGGVNDALVGFDPWSDPVRRLAMEHARDSGMSTISGRVRLAADKSEEFKPSFIMYQPIFAPGKPHDSIDQRRASLLGWAYLSFRIKDVMDSLYGNQLPGLVFAIYDGVESSAAIPFYNSAKGKTPATTLSANEYLVIGGHNWTLSLSALDDFSSRYGRNSEYIIAFTGISLTVLLSLLAWLILSSRNRTLEFAAGMTKELRASEEQFRAIADATVNWEIWWGLDGKPRWINPSVKAYTGYSVEECMAMPDLLGSLLYSEDLSRISLEFSKGLQGFRLDDLELRIVHRDQRLIWLSVSWAPTLDANGIVTGFRSSGRDITERKQVEEELRIAAFAFDSEEGIMITDAQLKILRVNRGFIEDTGYSAEEVIGQTPKLLKSDRHDAAFYDAMWLSIRTTGVWKGEIWDRRKNGEQYPKWLTISSVKGDGGDVTHYVATHHDISERKMAEERIRELAFFDALTRLPNRTLLADRIRQAMALSVRNESGGALLCIDLDHFKTLNDTLGHGKGDLLLQQVAHRLLNAVQEDDTVARIGGDEFVVVLENLKGIPSEAANQTKAVGERILSILGVPYSLDGVEYRSTASIGATLFKGQATSIDDLLTQSDLAMYKSKETGRNALRFFDPTMQTIVLARAELEAGLRKAIEANQFVLYYQAQVADGGRVVGAEALVRWQHPERGLVSPADFIPLAEETGLILPLGNWVLKTACRQLALWANQRDMAEMTLAVNVSAQQFREPDFVAKVLAILAQNGANPSRLKVELTESLLVDNVEDIIQKMYELKAQGVVFSLDDFGTGYSSLSYLKRLPLDQLKIDQSFVRDVLVDPNDAAIAKTIVTLGQSLGLGVIAEGVENKAQRDFLAGAGCHLYQGYYFCRPLPIAGFEEFARQYQ
ncbi:EAL domain-containing protein [Herbaspirillum sp. RTI4]|uniref:bifunctional diguanylate cyclase/phosphodiesterase n=1 Tax=Herbaspirillum sp. RTI4 TaxID=3048640 RepID=UPI002AB3638A|nr:EAL domain-containing protein [Herbaspirillum sp. RTI4]MDY7578279.1 EAL domain-containing protein [Herbaspirillum sp. RTI4]MEA9981228.1 EAL domain-containing protein [Herbaspirillum sp. RTI4]